MYTHIQIHPGVYMLQYDEYSKLVSTHLCRGPILVLNEPWFCPVRDALAFVVVDRLWCQWSGPDCLPTSLWWAQIACQPEQWPRLPTSLSVCAVTQTAYMYIPQVIIITKEWKGGAPPFLLFSLFL